VLLDTHVWLWVAAGDARKVGRRAQRLIERSRTNGELVICAASAFEVAALHAHRSIELLPSPEQWFRRSLDTLELTVIDITTPIALDAGLIARMALPDPLDRLIVASASHLGVPLMTRDQRIRDYAGATRRLQVIDAAA
jgi:PIN domain nuclease of toxin-antitoxin system